MQLFWIQIAGENAWLGGEEARHCTQVLRHRAGDLIDGIDGAGNKYQARITAVAKERVELALLGCESGWGEYAPPLTLIISPLKHPDRLEWCVEKAVELGVSEIRPAICARSVKPGVKTARLQSLALAAVKQSKRSRLPLIHEAAPLAECLRACGQGLRAFAWCEATAPLMDMQVQVREAASLCIAIGPEGDFTPEEAAAAQQAGFVPVSLGANRLRSETAALYGLSVFKTLKPW